MATNRVTPGMKRWRATFKNFKAAMKQFTSFERSYLRIGGFHRKLPLIMGLAETHRRSWKGPTRFQPRCPGRCGAPVDKDMERCKEHSV